MQPAMDYGVGYAYYAAARGGRMTNAARAGWSVATHYRVC